jgi:hypothetical protein
MRIKFGDLMHDCAICGGGDFHWNLHLVMDGNERDGWEYSVVNRETAEVMSSGYCDESPPDQVFIVLLGMAYECAIATRNGGNFHYKSGMVPFDQWVAMEWKSVDGGVYLPDPDIVWSAYREARGKTTQKA